MEPYIGPGVTRGVPLLMKSVVTDNNDCSYNLELGQDASALVWALLVRFAGGATPGWVELAGDVQTLVILPGLVPLLVVLEWGQGAWLAAGNRTFSLHQAVGKQPL